MIYLTYNDLPSGIYAGQVIDVCNFLNKSINAKIRIVAFISIRNFSANRKKIRQKSLNAIVLPMFPKHSRWKWNILTLKILFLFIGKQAIWSRGIFATSMALSVNKKNKLKVIYDARGAYKAEFEEYLHKVVHLNDDIEMLEKRAVLDSDFRLSVSDKLVDYWKVNYGYSDTNHVVIPCTLNQEHLGGFPSESELKRNRENLSLKESDIVFIYSGSVADWQSITLDKFLLPYMETNENVKVILLSNTETNKLTIFKKFGNRVLQAWVEPGKVKNYLLASDYGILLRESSITNKVASPTKFAEYLSSGLSVIISDGIGDFSEFVKRENCGFCVVDETIQLPIVRNDYSVKVKLNNLSLKFSKENYLTQYIQIVGVEKV